MKQILQYSIQRFVDFIFRRRTLESCMYILTAAMLKELTSIFYGNNIIDILDLLKSKTDDEALLFTIQILEVFFRNGYWVVFFIELALLLLVSLLIYINKSKPAKYDFFDSSILKKDIKTIFQYLLEETFHLLANITVPGVYETNYTKRRILSYYPILRARCYALFNEKSADLHINDSTLQELIELMNRMHYLGKVLFKNDEDIEGAHPLFKDFFNLRTQASVILNQSRHEININELKELADDPKAKQIIGFQDKDEFEEWLEPTAKSILSRENFAEKHLVEQVLVNKELNPKDPANQKFYEDDIAQFYNKLSRSGLAKFDNGVIVVAPHGLNILKSKLQNYKWIIVWQKLQKHLILD